MRMGWADSPGSRSNGTCVVVVESVDGCGADVDMTRRLPAHRERVKGAHELISYVIPTLNESATLGRTLTALRSADAEAEIVVSDGGSSDDTPQIASRFASRFLAGRVSCRGAQLNRGASEASGSILCFLHADVVPPPDIREQIFRSLEEPAAVGGGFRIRYDVDHPALETLGLLSRIPWRTAYYGDQGFFCQRAAFNAAGGFPEWPLFEEVGLAQRLAQLGKLVRANGTTTASARRFLERGPWRQLAINVGLCSLFYLGVSPSRLARWYGKETRVQIEGEPAAVADLETVAE